MKKNRYVAAVVDYFRRADKILWLIIIFIASFSLILLKSVSRATNTDYYQTQLLAILLGVFGAYIITLIDYNTLANYWYLIGLASLFLMIYTIFFGINISGSGGVDATAWINLAGRTFQPSELVKIAFILTYTKHLDIVKTKGTMNQPIQVFLLSCHAAVPVLLCFMQGDAGASIVFFVMFLFMSFSAGIHLRYFAILGAVVIIAVPILWKYVLSDYQIDRFVAVYNLDDPAVAMDAGYQQYQARISIGSGGFWGTGLFNGPRVQSNAVTFQHSDFIFSVVGEETGFFGCCIVILSLLLLMGRTLYVGIKARDDSGKTICFGFFGLIAFQSITNIGMCLALLPVMGVTLPFYSAGGSSAACLYFGFGLVQNVYMRRKDLGGVRLKRRDHPTMGYKKLKSLDPMSLD